MSIGFLVMILVFFILEYKNMLYNYDIPVALLHVCTIIHFLCILTGKLFRGGYLRNCCLTLLKCGLGRGGDDLL